MRVELVFPSSLHANAVSCLALVCHLLAGCDRANFSGLYSMRAGQGKRNHETYEPVRRTPSFARERHLAVARGPGLSTSCWAI